MIAIKPKVIFRLVILNDVQNGILGERGQVAPRLAVEECECRVEIASTELLET